MLLAAKTTFDYTGAAQTWTVPPDVHSATFTLFGAAGGIASPYAFGGLGGKTKATIAVTPGESVGVFVGGRGFNTGFNGGGGGNDSGRGGGATDVRVGGSDIADRVLVAGGGGAGGTCNGASGGAGGGLIGGDGILNGCVGPEAGGGGTQQLGGSATAPAGAGSFGLGGDPDPNESGSSGGGGGGWYGGGAGLDDGPGGGGSSFGPTGANFKPGVRQGDGLAKIRYKPDPRITAMRLVPKRFVAGPHDVPQASQRRSGRGSQIELTLNRSAVVHFHVVGALGHAAHTPKSFIRRLKGGDSSIRFSGTFAGKALRPGGYELRARPEGPRNSGLAAATSPFTILPG